MQSEVDELMEYYNIEEKSQLMKKWYDGYLFGKSEVYNPWSVLNQTKSGLMIKIYWQCHGGRIQVQIILSEH